MRALWGAIAVVAVAAGCADSEPPPAPEDTGILDDSSVEDEDSGILDDSGDPDADNDVDGDTPAPPTADFGDPCRSNADCVSGYCITSSEGFICTLDCGGDEDCPELAGVPMECQLTENFGVDGVQVCVPTQSSLCQPCFQDSNCFGGSCVAVENGSVCGRDCESNNDCPDGSSCHVFAPGGGELSPGQCLPDNLTCDCTAQNAGDSRACVREDEELGARCFGTETCDPSIGWVGCDARVPAPELCDGLDNDCNGVEDDGLPGTESCERSNELGVCTGLALCGGEEGWICQAIPPEVERCDLQDNDCNDEIDETFRDEDGLYVDIAHCGVCGNDCRERFDLAEATACEVVDGQPRCVITECRRGYALVGPTACLPLASDLCQACTVDAECNTDVGDECLPYGEAGFCGRDCSDASPFGTQCPPGYACDPEAQQCRLNTGTCLCGPEDAFVRPCTIPDPNDENNRCVGTQTCDSGDLGACVPPADECNGIDDDCDGSIDTGLLDPETDSYFTDAHCGRCYNDCPSLFADPMLHAEGRCRDLEDIRRGEEASCILECEPGFVDVNGVTADGCECRRTSPDADPPDPDGADENCDGIDGEVPRGWFVSGTGDDNAAGTRDAPLRTIGAAIGRAGGDRNHVYVASGVYLESVVLRAGVSVFGGYSTDYSRRDLRGNETAIFGQEPEPGALGAVNAAGIRGTETVFSGFTVVGFDNFAPGASSYAVHLADCDRQLFLRNNVIRAGSGGNGDRGGSGTTGTPAPNNAGVGQTQRSANATVCSQSPANRSAGGNGGNHICTDQFGQQVNASGGNGGTADCPVYNTAEGSGLGGQIQPGAGDGGVGGYNQLLITNQFGQCAFCLIPDVPGSTEVGVPGTDGDTGTPGDPGQGCGAGVGRVVSGQWIAGPARGNPIDIDSPHNGAGGNGFKGDPGGGGGGGGAGSGVQRQFSYPVSCPFGEVIGGGGGGGGGGGCGGTAGQGGTPGGGSFGVFLHFETRPATLPTLRDNTVERGFGGAGGDGGDGAEGGNGAVGRTGTALTEDQQTGLLVCSDPGGRGGDGGAGGAGGGGGGGCGGLSAGVFIAGHRGLNIDAYANDNDFPATGGGGSQGRGGVSIGVPGQPGAQGRYLEVAQ
jgi:hypothetical protein